PATFTGCRPTTRRDESPRPMPITARPFEMSSSVAYQLAVIVGSRMPGLVTKCPSLIFSVATAASGSVAYDSCQRMCESYVHPYSKPLLSATRKRSIIRAYGGSGSTVTPKLSAMAGVRSYRPKIPHTMFFYLLFAVAAGRVRTEEDEIEQQLKRRGVILLLSDDYKNSKGI